MATKAYRLKVGAVADPTLGSVFKPFYEAVLKARLFALRVFERMGQEQADAFLKGAGKAAEGAERVKRSSKSAADTAVAEAQRRAKAEIDAMRSVQKQRNEEHRQFLAELREQEREVRKAEQQIRQERRTTERATATGNRTRARELRETGAGAARDLGAITRGGVGVARDLAEGMGVSFNLSSLVRQGVEAEKLAVAISNASFREGGPREDARALTSRASQIGDRFAMDPLEVLKGLAAYQEKTGDLQTGKAALEDLARLAKATGTSLDDMVSASGDVANVLGTAFASPEAKGKAVVDVMKMIAGQGREGAVEIKSLSVQMAKLAAASTMFEGSADDNVKKMGALVQLSRQYGGAASSTQAATSIMSFVNTLRTPARRGRFKEFGVDIDSAQTGFLQDPFEIIRQSLLKSNGDIEKMKKMWANVLGDKPVTALASVFNRAGGGQKGIDAVNKELARFTTPFSEKEIDSNVTAAMGTRESQGQLFQNQLGKVANSVSEQVLPAMEQLAPVVVKAVQALGNVVVWAANNPGLAITAAIVASIGKAAVGTAVSAAMNSVVESLSKKIGAGGLAIGTATLAITAATLIVSKLKDEQAGGVEDAKRQLETNEEVIRRAEAEARGGTISQQTVDDLQKQKLIVDQQASAGYAYKASDGTLLGDIGTGISRFFDHVSGTKSFDQVGREELAANNMGAITSQQKGIESLLASIRDGTLKVVVTNAEDLKQPAGPPAVDSAGRTGGI